MLTIIVLRIVHIAKKSLLLALVKEVGNYSSLEIVEIGQAPIPMISFVSSARVIHVGFPNVIGHTRVVSNDANDCKEYLKIRFLAGCQKSVLINFEVPKPIYVACVNEQLMAKDAFLFRVAKSCYSVDVQITRYVYPVLKSPDVARKRFALS